MRKPIYLDYAATAPLLPEVLDAMLPLLTEHYGNPSSLHRFGRAAAGAVGHARDRIAAMLGCQSREIIFTSGGTEADNLAVQGAVLGAVQAVGGLSADAGRTHIITTSIEHHAVLHTCLMLERLGCDVTYLSADGSGMVSLDELAAAIRPETRLISVMYGNNEVGTIQPIEQIGELAQRHGALFHVDAVQAAGVVPIDLSVLPVDLMSFSAHKLGGPKGVGVLYCASDVALSPLMHGGSQEKKRRGGTENAAGIAGFAEALRISIISLPEKQLYLEMLRLTMIEGLTSELGADGYVVNGSTDPSERLPHILNVSFPGCSTETLLMNLDLEGIAAASGSACTSGSIEPSHVLKAMGLPEQISSSAVRFSFGLATTSEEMKEACKIIGTIVRRLRTIMK